MTAISKLCGAAALITMTSYAPYALAARVSYRIDNHSTVPMGRKKTDTITRIGVVYKMK